MHCPAPRFLPAERCNPYLKVEKTPLAPGMEKAGFRFDKNRKSRYTFLDDLSAAKTFLLVVFSNIPMESIISIKWGRLGVFEMILWKYKNEETKISTVSVEICSEPFIS
jgi:hypothetical protein